MPDYNPAVAATGLNTGGPDFTKTLGTISDLQRTQAQTGLVQLQQLQQMRQYNALQQAAQAYRSGQDGTGAYLAAGGDPAGANQLQTLYTNQRAMAMTPGHVMPQQANELLQGQKTSLELPGVAANSKKSQTEADAAVAKQYGPGVLLNPDDDASYAQLVNGHFDAIGGNRLENQAARNAALNVKDPNQRVDAAIRYGAAAGVPVQDLANTFNVNQPGSQSGQQPTQAAVGLKQPGEVEQAKQQAGYFNKLYSGISAAANTSAQAQNDVNIAKAAINDPNFYSGTGENWNLLAKKALAIGVDPTGAQPQEVFRKVMAQNVLQQINGLRAAQEEMGNAGGRIFQSQIDLMEKAAQNPDNTIASNRFLTELADRSINLNTKLGDMADNYKGGKLDAKFQQNMRDYVSKNPRLATGNCRT